jgi:hypothetical protein
MYGSAGETLEDKHWPRYGNRLWESTSRHVAQAFSRRPS